MIERKFNVGVVDAAVGWWVARLRGEDDLGAALHEHDVLRGLPSATGGMLGVARSKLIPEEKILQFEREMREWLEAGDPGWGLRPRDVLVRISTDYHALPPMDEIVRRCGISDVLRLPWKTVMHVFADRVEVNDRIVFPIDE